MKTSKKKAIPVPLETEECKAFAQYLRLKQNQGKVVKFTKTCQETFTKSWKQKNKNKAEGLEAGLPDYLIVLPKKIVFIEMKRQRLGVTSSYQKEWIDALLLARQEVFVCKGCDEAIEVVESLI